MIELGFYSLIAALVVSGYATTAAGLGAFRRHSPLIRSAENGLISSFGLIAVASGALDLRPSLGRSDSHEQTPLWGIHYSHRCGARFRRNHRRLFLRGTAPEMIQEIRELVSGGKTEQQVYAAFVG